MSKIWQVHSRICFDTTYFVVSNERPSGDNVLELANDGYIPEFKQEPAGPEYLLHEPLEVTEEEYLNAWANSIGTHEDVSKKEKLQFLVNLDSKPPEDLSFVDEIKDVIKEDEL